MKFFVAASLLGLPAVVAAHRGLQQLVEVETAFNCLGNCTVPDPSQDCFQLTDDLKQQGGVVWSVAPLDVANSFVVEVSMYFGTNDGPGNTVTNTSGPKDPGADGIGFMLQNQGPEILGSVGGGMGMGGIRPSLGVEFDTYQNPVATGDPVEDHLALVRDGGLNAGRLDGPNPLSFNLEDDTYHNVIFTWTSENQTLDVSINGTVYMSTSNLNLTELVDGNVAYLGFTSSTGGSSNRHEVCITSIKGSVFELDMPSDSPTESPMPSPSPSKVPSDAPSENAPQLVEFETAFNCLGNCTVPDPDRDCFQLTDDLKRQSGVVWSVAPLDIVNSFVVEVSMHFGTNDGPGNTVTNVTGPGDPGADGIGFMMQNQGPEILGSIGGGMGMGGIRPSLGVEFDTFQNPALTGDPVEDHLALVRDGGLNVGRLDGPNPLNFNLEDGTYHNVIFMWTSETQILDVSINGTVYMSTSGLNLTELVGGNLAYLGFTSSTGGSSNRHEVCIISIKETVHESEMSSVSPTESPMPSPSPSATPTESPMPSPSPSKAAPSIIPSGSPSSSSAPSCGKAGKSGKPGNAHRRRKRALRLLEGDDDDDDDDDDGAGKALNGKGCTEYDGDDDDDEDDADLSTPTANTSSDADGGTTFNAKELIVGSSAASAGSVELMVGAVAGLAALLLAF